MFGWDLHVRSHEAIPACEAYEAIPACARSPKRGPLEVEVSSNDWVPQDTIP